MPIFFVPESWCLYVGYVLVSTKLFIFRNRIPRSSRNVFDIAPFGSHNLISLRSATIPRKTTPPHTLRTDYCEDLFRTQVELFPLTTLTPDPK